MSRPFRAVQQLLRLLGETAWLFAWSAVLGYWLDPNAGPALPLWLLTCVMIGSAALARLASRGQAAGWVPVATSLLGVVVSVGAGLLSAYLAAGQLNVAELGRSVAGSRAFLAGCLALVAWWRGSRLGTHRPSRDEVEGEFRFGVLAVAGLLALIAVLGAGAAPEEATTLAIPALALVASGLLGTPLARIAEASAAPRADAPRLAPSGPWLATLLGIVGGLLLLTLLISGVLTAERVGAVLGIVLGAIWRVVWTIVLIAALPASYLVEWLVNVLQSLMTGKPIEQPLPERQNLDELLRGAQGSKGVPPELETLMNVILIAGAVGVVVLLLARSLSRGKRWQRESDGVEELRESVFGWEAVRELIAWILGRLRRPPAAPPILGVEVDPIEPRSVREVYREFLRLTARLGFPRTRSETPLEYATRLRSGRLTASAEAAESDERVAEANVDAMTGAYTQARYGRPEATPDPSPATRALETLRRIWRG